MREFESFRSSQAVRWSEKPRPIVGEMPTIGGLLRFGGRSPGSQSRELRGEFTESLPPHVEIFPFSGDARRRPGSIATAWWMRLIATIREQGELPPEVADALQELVDDVRGVASHLLKLAASNRAARPIGVRRAPICGFSELMTISYVLVDHVGGLVDLVGLCQGGWLFLLYPVDDPVIPESIEITLVSVPNAVDPDAVAALISSLRDGYRKRLVRSYDGA